MIHWSNAPVFYSGFVFQASKRSFLQHPVSVDDKSQNSAMGPCRIRCKRVPLQSSCTHKWPMRTKVANDITINVTFVRSELFMQLARRCRMTRNNLLFGITFKHIFHFFSKSFLLLKYSFIFLTNQSKCCLTFNQSYCSWYRDIRGTWFIYISCSADFVLCGGEQRQRPWKKSMMVWSCEWRCVGWSTVAFSSWCCGCGYAEHRAFDSTSEWKSDFFWGKATELAVDCDFRVGSQLADDCGAGCSDCCDERLHLSILCLQ